MHRGGSAPARSDVVILDDANRPRDANRRLLDANPRADLLCTHKYQFPSAREHDTGELACLRVHADLVRKTNRVVLRADVGSLYAQPPHKLCKRADLKTRSDPGCVLSSTSVRHLPSSYLSAKHPSSADVLLRIRYAHVVLTARCGPRTGRQCGQPARGRSRGAQLRPGWWATGRRSVSRAILLPRRPAGPSRPRWRLRQRA